MFGTENVWMFVVAGVALNLTPGPDTLYIVGRSVAQGRDAGVWSALGIATGTLVHTTAAALGRTPLDKLANCVEVWLRAPETAGPIFHVIAAEAAKPGSRMAAHRRHAIDALVAMLAEGIRADRGQEMDPLILRGLIGAMETIAAEVHAAGRADNAAIARAKAAMMHILVTSLCAPG